VNSLEDHVSENSLDFKTPALVLGSAPSVKNVRNFPFSGVRIGLGDMPVRAEKLGPYDYWVCANSYYPLPWVPNDRKAIEASKAITLIASMSVIHSNYSKEAKISSFTDALISPNYILYNQKHFNGNACSEESLCCEISRNLIQGPSIQELLGGMDGSQSAAYGEGSTVALHGYALAVLLKANPIYIAGVELPIKYKDYRAYRNLFRPNERLSSKVMRIFRDYLSITKHRNTDFGEAGQNAILDDFKSIAEIAGKLGIKTFSLSKTSPLNLVTGINFLEVSKSPDGTTAIDN
jgi:hypothetical protein